MPRIINLPDGRRGSVPDDATEEQIERAIQRYLDETYPEPVGQLETFAKEAGLSVAPTAAGLAAFGPSFAAGTALGAPLGPAAPIVGLGTGILGSLGAGVLTSMAQQKALEAAPGVQEALGVTPEELAAGREAFPKTAFAGQFAPAALALRPTSPMRLFAGKGADEAAREAAKTARLQAGVGAGVGSGIEAGMQAAGEEPLDPTRIAMAGLFGGAFTTPYGPAERAMRALTPGTRAKELLYGARPPADGTPPGEAASYTSLPDAVLAGLAAGPASRNSIAASLGIDDIQTNAILNRLKEDGLVVFDRAQNKWTLTETGTTQTSTAAGTQLDLRLRGGETPTAPTPTLSDAILTGLSTGPASRKSILAAFGADTKKTDAALKKLKKEGLAAFDRAQNKWTLTETGTARVPPISGSQAPGLQAGMQGVLDVGVPGQPLTAQEAAFRQRQPTAPAVVEEGVVPEQIGMFDQPAPVQGQLRFPAQQPDLPLQGGEAAVISGSQAPGPQAGLQGVLDVGVPGQPMTPQEVALRQRQQPEAPAVTEEGVAPEQIDLFAPSGSIPSQGALQFAPDAPAGTRFTSPQTLLGQQLELATRRQEADLAYQQRAQQEEAVRQRREEELLRSRELALAKEDAARQRAQELEDAKIYPLRGRPLSEQEASAGTADGTPPTPSLPDAVLTGLATGPASRSAIAAALGVEGKQASTILNRLKKEGLVVFDRAQDKWTLTEAGTARAQARPATTEAPAVAAEAPAVAAEAPAGTTTIKPRADTRSYLDDFDFQPGRITVEPQPTPRPRPLEAPTPPDRPAMAATERPAQPTRSERAVQALREGNLGSALYHLMIEGGRAAFRQRPDQGGPVISGIARTLFNAVNRLDDRSAIIASEQTRAIRELGIGDDPAAVMRVKANIQKLIENDLDLKKYDFTDSKGVLTEAGRIVKGDGDNAPFQVAYERMLELPKRAATYSRETGEFTGFKKGYGPESIKAGTAFGGAKVYAEGGDLPKTAAARIAAMKGKGRAAEYDPKQNAFYFAEEGLTDEIIMHEMVHAATVRVLNAYKNPSSKEKLTKTQREAAKHIDDIYTASKKLLGKDFKDAYKNVYEFVSNAMTEPAFQQALARLKSEDLKVPFRTKFRSAWDSLVHSIARAVGLEKYTADYLKSQPAMDAETMNSALLQIGDAFRDIVAPPKGNLRMQPLPAQLPKGADRIPASAAIQKRGMFKAAGQFAEAMLGTKAKRREAFYALRRLLQNSADDAKRMQREFRRAGIPTRIYDAIMGTSALARDRMTQIQPAMRQFDAASASLIQKLGLNSEDFQKRLHLYSLAVGEPGARKSLFNLRVPLSEAADTRRQQIIDIIVGADPQYPRGVTTQAEALKLRNELDALIAADLQVKNIRKWVSGSEVKATPEMLDIDSPLYNVAGDYTKQELADFRAFYNQERAQYPEIDQIFNPQNGILKQMKDATVKFNKEAGYHPPQLDSVIWFYNNGNYMPFKGNVTSPNKKFAEALNYYNSERLGGQLTELQNRREGRSTDSENPVVQILGDASRAALRPSTRDVTEELIKLVNNKKVKGEKIHTISFAEKYKGVDQAKLAAKNHVFLHKGDGSVEVWRIDDEGMLQAVKGFVTDTNPGVKLADKVTSTVASFHTKYNPAFPIYDYVRNAITNALIVGAGEYGPRIGAKTAAAAAARIADGGVFKGINAARLYATNPQKLQALAAKDPFYKSINDYFAAGGKTSYNEALSYEHALNILSRDAKLSPAGVIGKAKDVVSNAANYYMDGIELASRISAFDVIVPEALRRKSVELKRALTAAEEAAVKQEVTLYVRGLFDFSEMGKWGRELGALFMFIRPGMTGATRFWDALAPAFQNVDERLKYVAERYGITDPQQQAAYRKNFLNEQRNARLVTMATMGAGATLYGMSVAMAGEDEAGRNKVITDEMGIWGRNLRIPVPEGALGQGVEYLQIPWGFGFGMFGAIGAQVAAVASGGQSPVEAMENVVPIIMESAVPLPVPKYSPFEHPTAFAVSSVMPSIVRPYIEYAFNVDAFGRSIFYNRMSQYSDPYTGGERLPEMYSATSEWMANTFGPENAMSPKTLHFFVNNYLDGIGRVTANAVGLTSYMAGAKEFDLKEDFTPIAAFVGRGSSKDAGEFAELDKKAERHRDILKSLEDRPEQRAAYLARHPTAEIMADWVIQQKNRGLRDIRQRSNEVRRNPYLTQQQKRDQLDDLNILRDMYMRNIVSVAKSWDS